MTRVAGGRYFAKFAGGPATEVILVRPVEQGSSEWLFIVPGIGPESLLFKTTDGQTVFGLLREASGTLRLRTDLPESWKEGLVKFAMGSTQVITVNELGRVVDDFMNTRGSGALSDRGDAVDEEDSDPPKALFPKTPARDLTTADQLREVYGTLTRQARKLRLQPGDADAGVEKMRAENNQIKIEMSEIRALLHQSLKGKIDKKPDDDAADDSGTGDTRDDVKKTLARMRFEAKDSNVMIQRFMEDYREIESWPFDVERIAPNYLPKIFRNRLGAEAYAREYIRSKGLHDCKAFDAMVLCGKTLDMLAMFDGSNVLNSAAAEVMARRMYGLERAAEDVEKASDWKDKKLLKLKLVDQFCLTKRDRGGRATLAEKEVRKEMEQEALFKKFLEKVSAGS